jgi:hypothetical protein
MIDAVLSYHVDPISCGVTKFSQQLAKRLDVPWGALLRDELTDTWVPLLSLKIGEIAGRRIPSAWHTTHDLFLHDVPQDGYIGTPRRVFAANAEIADEIRPQRPDVIPAWCPSLVEAQPREPITVLSFGMAHKLRADLYATLKEKLDATGEPYVVYVSAALHDGTSFSDAAQSFETLRKLFGMNFVFLGTLSDEAMVDRLRTCTYVAAFFEKGLRENNTSVMAALEYGASVLTNHDNHTPCILQQMTHDIGNAWLPHQYQQNRLRAWYGWDKLVELIRHA